MDNCLGCNAPWIPGRLRCPYCGRYAPLIVNWSGSPSGLARDLREYWHRLARDEARATLQQQTSEMKAQIGKAFLPAVQRAIEAAGASQP